MRGVLRHVTKDMGRRKYIFSVLLLLILISYLNSRFLEIIEGAVFSKHFVGLSFQENGVIRILDIDVDFGAKGRVTESSLGVDESCLQVTNCLGLVSFVIIKVILLICHLKRGCLPDILSTSISFD